MIIVDVNLILYAYDSSSSGHISAKAWWESVLSGITPVGIPWATILAFIRISTNHRILTNPFAISEAVEIVDSWLDRAEVFVAQPSDLHWKILGELLIKSQAVANHVPDAHLAALALEHGATLCSTDRDFARYEGLKWLNPIG